MFCGCSRNLHYQPHMGIAVLGSKKLKMQVCSFGFRMCTLCTTRVHTCVSFVAV